MHLFRTQFRHIGINKFKDKNYSKNYHKVYKKYQKMSMFSFYCFSNIIFIIILTLLNMSKYVYSVESELAGVCKRRGAAQNSTRISSIIYSQQYIYRVR